MTGKHREFGKHYLVEFTGCPAETLSLVENVRGPFLEAARISGATLLGSQFHQFKPHGVSGMIFIAESHFSLHTWPEHGYAAFDVLTCGVMDPERAIAHLKQAFRASNMETRIFSRGFSQ